MWGVRKACADVFMPVSCVCSPSVRKTELSPVFVNLLKDQSRWVRMTAYQALGPFISTFADSNITSLLHNDNGEIVITDRELLAQRLEDLEQARAEEQELEAEAEATEDAAVAAAEEEEEAEAKNESNEEASNESTSLSEQVCDDAEEHKDGNAGEQPVIQMDIDEEEEAEDLKHLESKIVHSKSLGDLSLEEDRAKNYKMTSSESFNNFLYWRDPLPVLDDLQVEPGTKEIKDNEEEVKEATIEETEATTHSTEEKGTRVLLNN